MRGGRKHLKNSAIEQRAVALQNGHSIMKVLSLRGSNIIEVMDGEGRLLLALFPAKFKKSMWIKRGSYVIADLSGTEKAVQSGGKVSCIVSQVLYGDQVRLLQLSPEWPEIFKSKDDNGGSSGVNGRHEIDENDESDEDSEGLPPLESNTNRVLPLNFQSDDGSSLASDDDL